MRKLASADVASERAQNRQASLGRFSWHPKWVSVVTFPYFNQKRYLLG